MSNQSGSNCSQIALVSLSCLLFLGFAWYVNTANYPHEFLNLAIALVLNIWTFVIRLMPKNDELRSKIGIYFFATLLAFTFIWFLLKHIVSPEIIANHVLDLITIALFVTG